MNSYGYGRAQFYDLSTEMIQADVKGKSPRSVERFLIQLGILHSSQKRVDLLYEDEYIGVLTIFYYNRYLYLQFYVFLIFLLIFFISYLIMNLARAREHLELRVSQRTADLENEINNRRKTEENLRLTLDSIGDGVISTDRKGGS